jgi:hypothetical protein
LEKRRRDELTPQEMAIARQNRRWLKVLAFPTLIIGTVGVLLSLYASSRGPTVTPAADPTGYQTVQDGYFAYAIPKAWSTNSLFSDYAGDLFNGGRGGWAAESLSTRIAPIIPGEVQPAAFRSFGQSVPTAYQIGPAQAVSVTDATTAYRYVVTRPGGFKAVAIDAWESHTGAELWLLVDASPSVTDQILATLRGTES